MTIQLTEKLSSLKFNDNLPGRRTFLGIRQIPFRYYVMLMTFLSSAFLFGSRCVINVAILAMVKSPVGLTVDGQVNLTTVDQQNSTETLEIEVNRAETYDWSQAQQGMIIGAYFYSYAGVQISTGFLADKFNVVKLSALGHVFAALATLAIPLATHFGFEWLIIVRALLGLAHGPVLPCLYIIFEKWFTPQEKALAIALMTVGSNIGVAVVMPVTAWLCDNGFSGGWPSSFYVMAGVNLIFTIIWYITVTADPSDNAFVSDDEKKFIAAHVVTIPKRKVTVPWKKMIMSKSLWSVSLARGILSLGYHTVNSKIPLYLETILGYQLQGNGLINSLFYVAEAIGQLISGPLSKYLTIKGYLGLTVTRKLFEAIALIGPAMFMLSIPFLANHPDIIVLGLVLTMFTMGFSSGGDIPIVPEMAPGLVGTVFGFANTFSCCAGFLAPMSIGLILGDHAESVSKWNVAFYLFGGLQIVGFLFFALFATSKPRTWALVENTTKQPKTKLQQLPLPQHPQQIPAPQANQQEQEAQDNEESRHTTSV